MKYTPADLRKTSGFVEAEALTDEKKTCNSTVRCSVWWPIRQPTVTHTIAH